VTNRVSRRPPSKIAAITGNSIAVTKCAPTAPFVWLSRRRFHLCCFVTPVIQLPGWRDQSRGSPIT